MIPTTDRLSVGEFITLYEQAQDYVVARAKEAGQIPPGARSDEVIFEFGRRVEGRVREDLKPRVNPELEAEIRHRSEIGRKLWEERGMG